MAETIESFVGKLQADGVQAGRAAAQTIRAEAEREARQMIEEAEGKAKEIIAKAQADGEAIRARTEVELKLAARDTILRLQDTLSRALRRILTHAAGEKLGDPEFLGELLRDLVMQYVKADIEGGGEITINVSESVRHKLAHWAIELLHKEIGPSKTVVDLQGTLAREGFEYKALEGTVEVTVESVVDVLCELAGPQVRQIIAGAMNGSREGIPA